jgi:hypothetical protein
VRVCVVMQGFGTGMESFNVAPPIGFLVQRVGAREREGGGLAGVNGQPVTSAV